MKFKEIREFKEDSIRTMCIRHNFYTCGNNEEYTALLSKESLKPTTKVIAEIAVDIIRHSEVDDYPIESMMYVIAKECVETFYEAQEA